MTIRCLDILRQAVETGELRWLDWHFARFIGELLREEAPTSLVMATALLSSRVGAGDICLPLANWAERAPFPVADASWRFPSLANWRQDITGHPIVSATAKTPLTFDRDRLYLARYWHFETQAVDAVRRRTKPSGLIAPQWLEATLDRVLGDDPRVSDQRHAVTLALSRSFVIISGGPGTGKTHIVTALLSVLLEQSPILRVALAAPTGKAAMRLTDTLGKATPIPFFAQESTPRLEAQTLHRLLGIRPGRSRPFRHAGHPLNVDILIIDEASMIDLPMLARVFAALPEHAHLILLGDRDQLASVEAGAVLADLCCVVQPTKAHQVTTQRMIAVPDHVAILEHSFRFTENSGIGRLAQSIRSGNLEALHKVFGNNTPDCVWHTTPTPSRLIQALEPELRALTASGDVYTAMACFARWRVLCAVREGRLGVLEINFRIKRRLHHLGIDTDGGWYRGRPVIVLKNDYGLELFNGDIGLVWSDNHGRLRVYFDTPQGWRTVHPAQMPPHETAFAMTVHKSQGSEFDIAHIILPPMDSRALSREMVYTAITRARRQVVLWADKDILVQAISRQSHRVSGLSERLWKI